MAKILLHRNEQENRLQRPLFLARAGHEVVATMRNPSACDLEKIATDSKLPVTVLALNVDDDASVTEVFGRWAIRSTGSSTTLESPALQRHRGP
jgi:NAD(P)-dependent dehydrogenase (short-subunit alcohol dehydrogenase family)